MTLQELEEYKELKRLVQDYLDFKILIEKIDKDAEKIKDPLDKCWHYLQQYGLLAEMVKRNGTKNS